MNTTNTRRGFTQNINKDCHSRGMLSGIFRVRSRSVNKENSLFVNNPYAVDPRQKPSGMTPNLMGFTLIELLVVVLIIGILAAVAVPQYQKAVWKARAAEAVSMISTLQQAVDVYALANGEPDTLTELEDKLDVTLGDSQNGFSYDAYWEDQDISYGGDPSSAGFGVSGTNNDIYIWFFAVRYAGTTNWKRFCICNSDLACNICEGYQAQGWQMDDQR